MLIDIRYKTHTTAKQTQKLSQWNSCELIMWNINSKNWHYLPAYTRKHLPMTTYLTPNTSPVQIKDKHTTYLKSCASYNYSGQTTKPFEASQWKLHTDTLRNTIGYINIERPKKPSANHSLNLFWLNINNISYTTNGVRITGA